MDCKQLLAEFLKEYPEYEECIRYQDGVPFVGWTGLHVFLLWLRDNNHISDEMLARGKELSLELECRMASSGAMS